MIAKIYLILAREHGKDSTILAMINADWRDFQNTPAKKEIMEHAILIRDYAGIMERAGWRVSHTIQAPMSSERFQPNVVAAMQKKKILGVTSRFILVARMK